MSSEAQEVFTYTAVRNWNQNGTELNSIGQNTVGNISGTTSRDKSCTSRHLLDAGLEFTNNFCFSFGKVGQEFTSPNKF